MIEGQPYMDEVVAREGGELISKAGKLWTRCFHGEKSPSFLVNKTHGHCFGCGWHGDSIDYIRALHGLTFKDALAYLGIKTGTLTPAERQAAAQARRDLERKAELLREFCRWEQAAVDAIAPVLRAYRHLRATRQTFSEAELVSLAEVQGEVDILEHHYAILCGRNDDAKAALFQESNNG